MFLILVFMFCFNINNAPLLYQCIELGFILLQTYNLYSLLFKKLMVMFFHSHSDIYRTQ